MMNAITKIGNDNMTDKSEELIPDFIITPCLAFDERGYRIGYGGGYYDKTFSKFNKIKHRFISTAIAFDEQKVLRQKF